MFGAIAIVRGDILHLFVDR